MTEEELAQLDERIGVHVTGRSEKMQRAQQAQSYKTADYVGFAILGSLAVGLGVASYFLYDSGHPIWGTVTAVVAGLVALWTLFDILA
jgi:hypothetical protein